MDYYLYMVPCNRFFIIIVAGILWLLYCYKVKMTFISVSGVQNNQECAKTVFFYIPQTLVKSEKLKGIKLCLQLNTLSYIFPWLVF